MSATELLSAACGLRELIESEAELVEQSATMTPPVVDALVDAGLFRLLVPSDLGGSEASPSSIVDVCEELSFADGSVGWAFAQNTTVMAYAAYLRPEYAAPVAQARAGAGMFAPLGVAHEEDGGYRVSGSYPFGSGSGHAEFIGGAAMVMRDGEMAPFDGPLPQIRCFIVPAERTILKGNWDAVAREESAAAREQKLRETKAAASYATLVSKQAVAFAYEAAGSHGMRNPSRLQRCFRDIHVGAAHQVFDERNYVEAAKPALGVEPAPF